jgi:meiotic recombination protein REC8
VISANLGLNLEGFDKIGGSAGSQRSSLFPWDNAGASSSGGGNDVDPDVDLPIEPVNVTLRESINSRRESSLAPSQRGSAVGGLTLFTLDREGRFTDNGRGLRI